MEIKQIEFDDLVKQQAVFGPQDHLAKSIEKFFSVSIVARGSSVEITGGIGSKFPDGAV